MEIGYGKAHLLLLNKVSKFDIREVFILVIGKMVPFNNTSFPFGQNSKLKMKTILIQGLAV